MVPLVGCKGCTSTPDPNAKLDAKEEEARKKKQRLVADELKALPFSTETTGIAIKPGHWYQVRHKLKANFSDESLTATFSVTDREGLQIPFESNSVTLDFNRNISLAVGQEKAIQMTLLYPEIPVSESTSDAFGSKPNLSIRTLYTLRNLGTQIHDESFPSMLLDGYQYNLVVLSRDLSRHTFWRGLDCIVWRRADDLQENRINPHRIVDINDDELATQFPSQLAMMTGMSHLVINDLPVSSMSPDQQDALSDWLFFGGTIIVNGPEAVGGMDNSKLIDWIPFQKTSEGLWTDSLESLLNDGWTVRVAGGAKTPLVADRKISILDGQLTPDSQWISGLEGLVAERLLGQGRVVMTTFPMTDAAFLRWPSYSSLIHNAILRKPHRTPTVGMEASTMYADSFSGSERNPLLSTRLRLWARDLDLSTMRSDDQTGGKQSRDASAQFPTGKSTSVGAWNPESRIVQHAADCLRESSGITVPQVRTILRLLIGYLVILVPVNWLIFRLIGRVELAWLAAPIIALIGAVVVARSVQLDIGFSRSQTTYGFLECHNGHPRGCLSSFHALYTSLSTNYQAVYKEREGLVVPMPRNMVQKSIKDRTTLDYWLADQLGSGLQRLPVLSNTTGMIQSEEMVPFDGPIAWTLDAQTGNVQATNETGIPIRDIGVLGLSNEGELMRGWLGSAEPGRTVEASVALMYEDDRWFSEWDANPLLKKPDIIRARDGMNWTESPVDDVYLGPLLLDVAQRYPLQRGEWIALGWTDQEMTDLEITPSTVQKKQKTLVLMHVKAGDLTEVQPDTRLFAAPEFDLDSP